MELEPAFTNKKDKQGQDKETQQFTHDEGAGSY